MLLSEVKEIKDNRIIVRDSEENNIVVECNDVRCKHRWTISSNDYTIEGNRIIAGPMISCPRCGRIDRPYVVSITKDQDLIACPKCNAQFQRDVIRPRMRKWGKDQSSFYTTKHCPHCDGRITLRDDNPNVEALKKRIDQLERYKINCRITGDLEEFRETEEEIKAVKQQIESIRAGVGDSHSVSIYGINMTVNQGKNGYFAASAKYNGKTYTVVEGTEEEAVGHLVKEIHEKEGTVDMKTRDAIVNICPICNKRFYEEATRNEINSHADEEIEKLKTSPIGSIRLKFMIQNLEAFRRKALNTVTDSKTKDAATVALKQIKNLKRSIAKDTALRALDSLKKAVKRKTKDQDNEKIEAYGVKGNSNTKWRRIFSNRTEMMKWVESNNAEIQGTRKAEPNERVGNVDKKIKDELYDVTLNLKGENHYYHNIDAPTPDVARTKCVSSLELKAGKVKGSLQNEFDGSKNNVEVKKVKTGDKKTKDVMGEQPIYSSGKYTVYKETPEEGGKFLVFIKGESRPVNVSNSLTAAKEAIKEDIRIYGNDSKTKDWLDPQAKSLSDKVVIKMKEIYKRTKENNIYDLFNDATQALGISGEIKEDVRILTLQGANYGYTEQFVFKDSKPTAKDAEPEPTPESYESFGNTVFEKTPEFDVRNIEKETIENNNFRKVLFTGKNIQLVLMSLLPEEDIGMEVHADVDQFFRIEKGEGILEVKGQGKQLLQDGSSIVIKAGTQHNIKNIGEEPLKLYTLYSPPNHPPDRLQSTKQEAVDEEKTAKGE